MGIEIKRKAAGTIRLIPQLIPLSPVPPEKTDHSMRHHFPPTGHVHLRACTTTSCVVTLLYTRIAPVLSELAHQLVVFWAFLFFNIA